jgi:cysteine desulfuration protein SufE
MTRGIKLKTIREKQDAVICDFEEVGDGFMKYAHLLGFASQSPKMRPSEKNDSNLLQECQSGVWLNIRVINGLFYFTADSDAMIIKGILYLLQFVMCGQHAREVAEAEIDFLQRIDMTETLSPGRQNDLQIILHTLQERARLLLSNSKSIQRRKHVNQVSLCLHKERRIS